MSRTAAVLLTALLLAPLATAVGIAEAQQVPDPMSRSASAIYYARSTGSCTWSPTGDAGPCINQAIEAAYQAGGGTVLLPSGTYGVSTTISTTRNYIGIGCNVPSGTQAASLVTPEAGGCTLKWIGAAGGRIMNFSAVEAGASTQSQVGIRVENIKFDGNNGLAADGLRINGMNGGVFNGLRFVGGFNGGKVINMDIPQIPHNPLPVGDQHNRFADTAIYNGSHSSVGIYLGFYGSGTGAANASGNYFVGTQAHSGTTGIHCHGCDLNMFSHVFASGGGGGYGIDLDIYNVGGNVFPANHNMFVNVGASSIARGTTSRPFCVPMPYDGTGFGSCTWGNVVSHIDGQNGQPPTVIETGAFATYTMDWGGVVNTASLLAGDGQRPAQTVIHDMGGSNVCGKDATTFGAGTGSYYCGPDWNYQYFSNGNAAAQAHYGMMLAGPAGAEKLVWRRWAGTGLYEFADAPIRTAVNSVGGLPVCDASRQFSIMSVTDQAGAPTYRGALTGGGALTVLAFCNGTSWEAH